MPLRGSPHHSPPTWDYFSLSDLRPAVWEGIKAESRAYLETHDQTDRYHRALSPQLSHFPNSCSFSQNFFPALLRNVLSLSKISTSDASMAKYLSVLSASKRSGFFGFSPQKKIKINARLKESLLAPRGRAEVPRAVLPSPAGWERGDSPTQPLPKPPGR